MRFNNNRIRKFVPFIILLLTLISLPIVIFLSQHKQDIRNRAAGTDEPNLPTKQYSADELKELRTPEAEITPFDEIPEENVPESLKQLEKQFDITGIKPVF